MLRRSIRGLIAVPALALCLNGILTYPVFANEMLDSVQAESAVERNEPELAIPHRAEGLSDEEIENGWYLENGFAYPPEYAVGNSGYVVGGTASFSNEDQLSMVTFKADVQLGLTEPCIIYFQDAATYKEYYVELYSSNGYKANVKMPPGSYYFTGGGPEGDDFGLFEVVSPLSFTVPYRKALLVEPVIRSRGEMIHEMSTQQTVSEEPEGVTESQSAVSEETTPDDTTPWFVYLKWSAILFGIAALLIGAVNAKRYLDSRQD